jgi:transcriptional regulator with XRE-family HTH domain
MHLAALAKVSRSTLSRFENNNGDVQLSSVLRILSVLDMVDRKQEGTLIVRRNDDGTFSASFALNLGAGGALESKTFADREVFGRALEDLDVSPGVQLEIFKDLEDQATVRVFGVALDMDGLQRYWPMQFAAASTT